jgi:murein DD-endopeptidase MepM/ murein hydrolase activator NlpD
MKSLERPLSQRWYSPAVLLLLLTIGGCGSVLVGTYGYGRFPPSPDVEITMPAGAPSITQAFRPVDPVHSPDPMGEHDGIDIVAPAGTPVIAAAPGRVVRSHLTVIRGHRVVVEHGRNGQGETVRTEYVHLKSRLVKEGDEVVRGGQVGELGMTGATAGYPHLHFMVVAVEGKGSAEKVRAVNPHLYWAGGEGVVTCFAVADHLPERPAALTYPVACRVEEGT